MATSRCRARPWCLQLCLSWEKRQVIPCPGRGLGGLGAGLRPLTSLPCDLMGAILPHCLSLPICNMGQMAGTMS